MAVAACNVNFVNVFVYMRASLIHSRNTNPDFLTNYVLHFQVHLVHVEIFGVICQLFPYRPNSYNL